jgi:hypothetical protein
VRAAALAFLAIAFVVPGASAADTLPSSPGVGTPGPLRCVSECVDPRVGGDNHVAGNGPAARGSQPELPPAENERLAELFLFALLASLLLIVPVVVTWQRNAGNAWRPTASPRRVLQLVWSSREKNNANPRQ